MFLPLHLWFAAVAFENGWRRRAYLPIGVAAGIIGLSAAFCALVLGDIELTFFPWIIVELVLAHVLAVMMEIPPSANTSR